MPFGWHFGPSTHRLGNSHGSDYFRRALLSTAKQKNLSSNSTLGIAEPMDSAISLVRRGGVFPQALEPKQEVQSPSRIHSHEEFADAILKIHDSLSQTGDSRVHFDRLLKRAYYLLGWLAGDAVKQFASRGPKARIGIALCKKHPENLLLGGVRFRVHKDARHPNRPDCRSVS